MYNHAFCNIYIVFHLYHFNFSINIMVFITLADNFLYWLSLFKQIKKF